MDRTRRVGVVVVILSVGVALLAAAAVSPEKTAQEAFDKAVASAKTVWENAVLRAFSIYENSMKSMTAVAEKANDADRVTELQKQLDEVRKLLSDLGITLPPESGSLRAGNATSETYARKSFDANLAAANEARRKALQQAYAVFEGRLRSLLGAAQRANQTARVTELRQMLDAAAQVVTDGGGTVVKIPTQAEFQAVMDRACVRCHRKAAISVAAQKQVRWIVPGRPEQSRTYTVIGKHRKAGSTYHNLTGEEKALVYTYIKAGAPEY